MTAAHCLRDAFAVKSSWVEIEVGKYKYVTRPDGTIARIGYAPFYKEKNSGNFLFTRALTAKIRSQGLKTQIGPQEDLAVIVLDSTLKVPPGFAFAQVIGQQELRSIAGAVGQYGPTVISINIFANMSTLDSKRFALLNSLKWNGSGYYESTSSSRVEEGDSAALLVQIGSAVKIVGVVKGRGQSTWGNWDVFTALDQKACEIAGQISDPQMQKKICL